MVSKVLLDTVLLLVLTVSPVPAHVVVARLVVPDLTMVSSEVSVSDTNFSQDTYGLRRLPWTSRQGLGLRAW